MWKKTGPVDISSEVIPSAVTPVVNVSAAETSPVAPQINVPQTSEIEVGKDLEQGGEVVFAPVDIC